MGSNRLMGIFRPSIGPAQSWPLSCGIRKPKSSKTDKLETDKNRTQQYGNLFWRFFRFSKSVNCFLKVFWGSNYSKMATLGSRTYCNIFWTCLELPNIGKKWPSDTWSITEILQTYTKAWKHFRKIMFCKSGILTLWKLLKFCVPTFLRETGAGQIY